MRGRPYRPARPKADPNVISSRDAEIQLLHLLTGARIIENFTAESLRRTHRVPLHKIEKMLATEQERRRRLL